MIPQSPGFDAIAFQRHLANADALLLQQRPDDALGCLSAALALDGDHVETRLRAADLHLAATRHNPARAQIMAALRGHIASPKVALALVSRLSVIGESSLVADVARQLPPPMWDSATSLAEFARHLTLMGAHDLADQFAQAAVKRDGGHPPSLFIMATMDVFFGRLDAAAAHAERCLAILPGEPATHWLLSRLRLPNPGLRIDRIRRAIAATSDPAALTWLWYGLHNELHDARDYAAAWTALEQGCREKRSQLRYDPADDDALHEALLGWGSEELAVADGHVDPGLTPVFVIGLHRSGTTLVERILGGHSRVTSGGETYDVTSALRRASGTHFRGETSAQAVASRAGYDYRRFGEEYLQGIRWRAAGRPMVTDKLPSNFLNLGFIARALPQARFIHLRRDALDVGLSNLRTLFNEACPHSYDQGEFVQHHRRYLRLMAHWREVMPGRILDVDYDDVVNDPEAAARRMSVYCGVEFEPGMVRIQDRTDAVSTASSVMMRDGIRKDRGQLWKAYEAQLQPMIQGLAAP